MIFVKPALAVVSAASIVASCFAVPSLLKSPQNLKQQELVQPPSKDQNHQLNELEAKLEEAKREKDNEEFKPKLEKYYRERFCYLDQESNTYSGCSRGSDFVYERYYDEYVKWLEEQIGNIKKN